MRCIRAGKQEEDITHKMVGLKEVLVVALLCSCMPCWACFGGSDAPEGSFSDFCQICVDMVTKANGMEVMDSEEYLRHVSHHAPLSTHTMDVA